MQTAETHPSAPRLDALSDARSALERLVSEAGDSADLRILSAARVALENPEIGLPQLPEAAIQAALVVDSPRCDVLDLADTLNAEPSLAARVVAISNSRFFAGSEPVYSARDAIVRMGIRETRNVVMGLLVRAVICDGPGFSAQRRSLWHHSLATAACAQGILCELAFEDSVGFLAGLAHDLGRAALLSWTAQEVPAGIPADRLEPIAEHLHALLGAAILSHWRLRGELIAAVRWHHGAPDGVEAGPVARALLAADRMAHRLAPDLPASGEKSPDESFGGVLDSLGISPARATVLRAESAARFDEFLKIF